MAFANQTSSNVNCGAFLPFQAPQNYCQNNTENGPVCGAVCSMRLKNASIQKLIDDNCTRERTQFCVSVDPLANSCFIIIVGLHKATDQLILIKAYLII